MDPFDEMKLNIMTIVLESRHISGFVQFNRNNFRVSAIMEGGYLVE